MLVNFKWSECAPLNPDAVGVAFHSCCLIVHPERSDIQLYKGMEASCPSKGPIIKEEGLYFFGGRNEFGEFLNNIMILKIGSRDSLYKKVIDS